MKIRAKKTYILPLLFIFLAGILLLLFIVGSVSTSTLNTLTNEIISARVGEYVNKTNDVATTTAGVVSFLATVVRDFAAESDPSREKVVRILSEVLMDNDDLFMVWTCWEPDSFDGRDAEYAGTEYHDETGRFAPYLVKNDESYSVYALHDYDDTEKGEYYNGPLKTGGLYVSEPYYYSTEDSRLFIYSVAMPIIIDGEAKGVVGADISVDKINSIMNSGHILEDGFLFTITAGGTILTHPESNLVMRHYSELADYSPKFGQIMREGGEYYEVYYSERMGKEILFTAVTYDIGGSGKNWTVCGVVPVKTAFASANMLIFWVAVSGVILGIVVIIVVRFTLLTKDIALERDNAVEKERAKSVFLANMSHEIRTPLNAITGMTAIGKTADNIEKKDYAFEKIEDASSHLLGVINDILDMSKIEANKFALSESDFNFEKMLQKVVTVVNFRIHEKDQHFIVLIDSNIPKALRGDSQRIAQVVTNLLSNAVKFTPEKGSIRLEANLVNEEDGVCTLRVDVTDTGIGIAPDKQELIFEVFEQAENSTSRKFGGTGLGLSISKHIVERMGGGITVKSEPGKGSKFSFTVKLKKADSQPGGAPVPQNPVLKRENIRILVVDDDVETRIYFADIAKNLGITCDTAASGEDALGQLEKRNDYHIIFIDWQMPGMSGIELTEKIGTSGQALIIMISAFDWADIEGDAQKAGVTRFLSKPLFPSTVEDCINGLLGGEVKDDKTVKSAVSFKGCRLLLAEDIEINREIVMEILKPTQAEIDCAVNGEEALKMFGSSPEKYDLIFMDVHMPEMDGLEATRRIRALGFGKAASIPIVAMTANVFREDVEICKEAGMTDHVGKPLDFDEIIEKMKLYCNNNKRGTNQ